MIASQPTADLLAILPGLLPGVEVDRAGNGRPAHPPAAPPDGSTVLHRRLPQGGCIALRLSPAAAGAAEFLGGLLDLLVQRDQLELDMESMNLSSLQLLEQVAMLGETLPRLSAGETDEEIAATGLKACVVAAGVERAVYLRQHAGAGLCEVQVYVENDGVEQAAVRPFPGDGLLRVASGPIADVLASGEGIAMQQVAAAGTAGAALAGLARRELLAVPVTYGAGDKRICLGALVLCDKASAFGLHQALGSEEGQVALSFASMLGAVLGARQTAALGKELSMAQAIQAQILPDRPAVVAGFELAGDYRTSGEVGGDYFDYVPLADGRTLVVIADVSGHNLASGMMMVSARATLRTLAAVRSGPALVFEDLAASMFTDLTRTERFITAAAVALRPGDPTVEIVSAGHNDLMLYRAARDEVIRLPCDGMILGFLPDARYASECVRLEPGDCLLLYTDGVTEATDQHGLMFGEDRLAEVLAGAARTGGARGIVAAILAAVERFLGPGARRDDMTLVAIRALSVAGASR